LAAGFGAAPGAAGAVRVAGAAGPFTVNNTADLDDANPGDGLCETAPGNAQCTLRAAVRESNALAGADTILLGSATYTLTLAGNDSNAAAGDLDISDDLTIQGQGAGLSIITLDDNQITDGAFTLLFDALTLRALTVRGAYSTSSGAAVYNFAGELHVEDSVLRDGQAYYGGAIFQTGAALTVLQNTQLISNTAVSGGAVFLDEGTATLTGVTAQGNHAYEHGGALAVDDAASLVALVDTQLISNTADLSGGGAAVFTGGLFLTRTLVTGGTANYGAGLFNTGALTVTTSTVSSNHANYQGGGLYQTSPGVARLGASTFSGNTAATDGGGIYNGNGLVLFNTTLSGNRAVSNGGGLHTWSGTVALYNVTIASNTADDDYDGTGVGGGVRRTGGTVNLYNTLIGNNINRGSLPLLNTRDDCAGTLVSHGNNLLEETDGCTLSGIDSSDRLEEDPVLGALADNRGPTRTHALLPGSPAIDRGNSEICTGPGNPSTLSFDQRGFPRYADGDGNGFARCDIGAFELVLETSLPLALR
jgi:CSLREA domain-containing protein